MKVPRFLCFLKAMRENKRKERSALMVEMVDIAQVALGDQTYNKGLRAHYIEANLSEEQRKRRKNPRLFDAGRMDQSKAAAKIINDALNLKGRLEGII